MGSFLANYKSSPIMWATFLSGKRYEFISKKNGLGYILGDFFTNSSGHTD
jgi:hypothetical protein